MLEAFWLFFFHLNTFFIQKYIQDLKRGNLHLFRLRTKQALRDLTVVTIVILCLFQLLLKTKRATSCKEGCLLSLLVNFKL